jgi:hypothetical protein
MKNLLLGLLLGILVASVQQAYTQQQPERIAVGTLGTPGTLLIC